MRAGDDKEVRGLLHVQQINVAIIGGAGFMGKAHSFAWSMAAIQSVSEAEIAKKVLVEIDPDLAERTARTLGWEESAVDWKAVVDRPDIHVIDIVTPPNTHAEIAQYAAARGKHVLCEKPLANSTDEIAELLETVESAGVTNQVGFNYRHNSAVQLARQMIAEGKIGRVIQARFEYHQDAAFNPIGWRSHKATGGSGASSDIGSHIVDMANYLIGSINAVAAQMQVVKMSDDDTHDVDDAGAFLAQFDGGALGIFSFSQKAWGHNNHIRFEIDGTEGGLAFDWNRRDQLEVFHRDAPARGFTTVHVDGKAPGHWFDLNGVGIGYLESSANQVISFVANIVDGTPNGPSFREGAYVQRVIEAVWRSAESGAWTDVN